jgi:hypothetical protein
LTSAQLSSLIDGVGWRAPEQRWRPAVAGYRCDQVTQSRMEIDGGERESARLLPS